MPGRSVKSMRKQILLGLATALIFIMGVAGVISYRVALHEADEIFSARLATSARVLESLLARQVEHASLNKPLVIALPQELSAARGDDPLPTGHPYETKLAFQVWGQGGRLLVRSESAPANDRLGPLKEGFFESRAGNREWHVFTLHSSGVWIEVGEEVGFRKEIASEVGSVLISPLGIGALLLFVFVNVIVAYGFRPLENLAHLISERSAKDPSPIKLSNPPAEIAPVVDALNALLTRVNEAMARERRFTDSAAHELRTPLAALSIHAENMVAAETEEERAISQAQLLTGLSRAKYLVEQMLTYSRISSETHGEPLKNLDWSEEIRYLVNNQKVVVEDIGLRIELALPDKPVIVQGRVGLLEILFRNLLDNACKYNDKLTEPVRVKLVTESENAWRLTIENHAPKIDPSECQRVFEPYYRLPNSHVKGNGLGLAMVREIAGLHGWKVQFSYDLKTEIACMSVVGQMVV